MNILSIGLLAGNCLIIGDQLAGSIGVLAGYRLVGNLGTFDRQTLFLPKFSSRINALAFEGVS
jgi:hypothetical protein